MVRRTVNMGEGEPEQKQFDLPSEGEKLFQVVDVFEMGSEMGDKLSLDIDTVSVKCEVAIGDELGRTLLNRLNLNETSKGFFATRLFLKAIGEAVLPEVSPASLMLEANAVETNSESVRDETDSEEE